MRAVNLLSKRFLQAQSSLVKQPKYCFSSSGDNTSDTKTIYKQSSNNAGVYGLIGGSFISAILIENFAVPLTLGTIGFSASLATNLIANEILYNQLNQHLTIKQNRRMLLFRPNTVTVPLNQINVLYLGNKFAFININNDDAMKTYLLPLSEDNTTLIQLLKKRQKN